MKKSILLVAAVFSIAVLFTSCKETKKEEIKTENHESHEHDADTKEATADVYQCPMDCEKGKTYDEAGSCPACKMDLKKQSADKDGDHAVGCTCKEGGECKCEPGKCQCKEEVACTKCEPGKCECKAKTASVKKECAPKCKTGSSACKGEKKVASNDKDCSRCEPGMCECKA